MRRLLQTASWIALAGIVVPALLFFAGTIDLSALKISLLIATIVWFIATPMWMGKEEVGEAK